MRERASDWVSLRVLCQKRELAGVPHLLGQMLMSIIMPLMPHGTPWRSCSVIIEYKGRYWDEIEATPDGAEAQALLELVQAAAEQLSLSEFATRYGLRSLPYIRA